MACVAITDTGNVSLHIHIMDINTTAPHTKIEEVELLNSEITGMILDYSIPHKKTTTQNKNKKHTYVLSFLTYLSNIMDSSTQTLVQIKSKEFICYIKQHFMTMSHVYHQYHSRFCEMLYQTLSALRLLTR